MEFFNGTKRDITLKRCGEVERESNSSVEAKGLKIRWYLEECTNKDGRPQSGKGVEAEDLLMKAGRVECLGSISAMVMTA